MTKKYLAAATTVAVFSGIVALAVILATPASASRLAKRTAGRGVAQTRASAGDTLQIRNALFFTQPTSSSCPSGSPSTDVCFSNSGTAKIPGLGVVTEMYPIISAYDNLPCIPFSIGPVTFTVAGKQGTLDASVEFPAACNVPPGTKGTLTITGGSGIFTNASGNGTLKPVPVDNSDDSFIDEDDIIDSLPDHLTLSLTAPNTTFDLAPPVISGAHSKTVRVPKTAKFARVKFKVTAQDAADGPVPVTCTPKSGSHFKIGHTKVKCSATDSSANKATAKFTITVKHR
jgi:HYR domain-containing protein